MARAEYHGSLVSVRRKPSFGGAEIPNPPGALTAARRFMSVSSSLQRRCMMARPMPVAPPVTMAVFPVSPRTNGSLVEFYKKT
jgi:hypothetical protein